MHFDSTYRGRVALGLSGGVDSSVAAALLLDAGYDVVGVTCLFTDDAASHAAAEDARRVSARLGIEHAVRDCTEAFARCVVEPFVDCYACGLTPSPCVGCNARVKIPSLLAVADELGCEFVATGHYARVVCADGRFAVACSADARKDQSYMLSMLGQEQLSRLLLPLGDIAGGKAEVRRMAAEHGLPTASKSESQDICFIERSHLDFLEAHGLAAEPGDIVTLDGCAVGRHKGLFRYTVGQRKGLEIGGAPEPYYVVEKDVARNRLVVGFARDALIESVRVSRMNWQGISSVEASRRAARGEGMPCSTKLRYRQRAAACRMRIDGGDAFVTLDEPQATTAPGQVCVLYDGDTVLGAGVIEETIRSRGVLERAACAQAKEERA